jgi:hypothetical protein
LFPACLVKAGETSSHACFQLPPGFLGAFGLLVDHRQDETGRRR